MSAVNERSAFIEEAGLYFESLGMTRMAGRILGYLMVTDKEMVSFDELTQVLHASKSSISTSVKLCVNVQFVKPMSLTGDRKTYYMLSPDVSWVEIFQRRTEQIKYMQGLLNRAMNLRANEKDKPSQWLKEAREFYDFILREFPELLAKWEAHKQSMARQ